MADDAVDKAATKWNEAHKISNYRARFAMSHPVYARFIYDEYLGGTQPIGILRRLRKNRPFEYAAELACGRGDLAVSMLTHGIVKRLDGFDVSQIALEQAHQKASERGLTGASFTLADVNAIVLPENKYDLIYFPQSLHHIQNLEHVYEQIQKALVNDGIFFASDYVGPSYMQWTDQQLDLMNRILMTLPEKYRVLIDGGKDWHEKIKTRIGRTSVDRYLKNDPSEGVRAAEIVPLAREAFDIIAYYPMGGTITYELLRGIVHNFKESDENDVALLRLLAVLEHELIMHFGMSSDFACFFARKKI